MGINIPIILDGREATVLPLNGVWRLAKKFNKNNWKMTSGRSQAAFSAVPQMSVERPSRDRYEGF